MNGFFKWDRRGMISGLGKPEDWNGYHFKSPAVLDVGDFLLVAFEGWMDPHTPSGIGLMIGVERWLKPKQNVVVLSYGNGYSNLLELDNNGAGDLNIESVNLFNPQFELTTPNIPFTIKAADKLSIPIHFTGNSNNESSLGIITIRSDSVIEPVQTIYLIAY